MRGELSFSMAKKLSNSTSPAYAWRTVFFSWPRISSLQIIRFMRGKPSFLLVMILATTEDNVEVTGLARALCARPVDCRVKGTVPRSAELRAAVRVPGFALICRAAKKAHRRQSTKGHGLPHAALLLAEVTGNAEGCEEGNVHWRDANGFNGCK